MSSFSAAASNFAGLLAAQAVSREKAANNKTLEIRRMGQDSFYCGWRALDARPCRPVAAPSHKRCHAGAPAAAHGASMTYLVVKWLHILSSTVMFGTGLGSAYQMFFACRTRDPHIAAA